MTLLDIGGGTLPAPGYLNLDRSHGSSPELQRFAQDTPWPFRDGEVERARASHFLEHIPSGDERIAVMNEVWRVLRPGGQFEIIVPLIGYTDPETGHAMGHGAYGEPPIGWQPHADPTHVSTWWFPESLLYFCEGPFHAHADYGIRYWAGIEEWHVENGWEGHAVLWKPA